MKTLLLFTLLLGLRLNAASIAICIDSKSPDTKPAPYFQPIEVFELPQSALVITKAPPVDSNVTIIVGGNVQIFDPSLNITIDLKSAGVLNQVRQAALAHPTGHIMLIKDGRMMSIIRTDVAHRKEPRLPLVDFVTDAVTFHVSEPMWKNEN